MNKPSTFAKRLRELLEIQNMTQAELSRKTGVSKSSITHYLKGDWEAKQDAVYSIATSTNVSEAWLMGYDVPMVRSIEEILFDASVDTVYNQEFNALTKEEKERALNSVRNESKPPTPVAEDGLDDEKRAFIEKLKSMDPDTVAALNKLADTIIAKREK